MNFEQQQLPQNLKAPRNQMGVGGTMFDVQQRFNGQQTSSMAVAAASKPAREEESFYESLLRHERENGSEKSSAIKQNSNDDDRKLPAQPSPQQGRQRKPIALPYAKNHVASHNSGQLPVAPGQAFHGQLPSPSTGPKTRLPPQASRSFPNIRQKKDHPFERKKGHTRGLSPDEPSRSNRGSFYRAALEAAGVAKPPPPEENTSDDERIARELSHKLETQGSFRRIDVSRDEEIAREISQKLEFEEKSLSIQDELLALQISEEQMFEPPPTADDEILALELSKKFAEEAQQPPSGVVVDEQQVQILERIRQNEQRRIFNPAMPQPAMHGNYVMGPMGSVVPAENRDFNASYPQQMPFAQWTGEETQMPPPMPPRRRSVSQQDVRVHFDDTPAPPLGSPQRYASFSGLPRGGAVPDQQYALQEPWPLGESRQQPTQISYVTPVQTQPRAQPVQPIQHAQPVQLLQPVQPMQRMAGAQQVIRTQNGNPVITQAFPVNSNPNGMPVSRGRPTLGSSSNSVRVIRGQAVRPPSNVVGATSIPYSVQPSQQPQTRTSAEFLRRGERETRMAISAGQARVVTCQGCNQRMQAPMNASLVFCPQCNVVSPVAGGNGAVPGVQRVQR